MTLRDTRPGKTATELRDEAEAFRKHADQLDGKGRKALADAHRSKANALDVLADDREAGL